MVASYDRQSRDNSIEVDESYEESDEERLAEENGYDLEDAVDEYGNLEYQYSSNSHTVSYESSHARPNSLE